MANNISRILKDHFLTSEEGMKNKTYFEKGRVRRGTDMVTGGTYMKLYSKKKEKYSRALAPLQTGMGWKKHFLNESGV